MVSELPLWRNRDFRRLFGAQDTWEPLRYLVGNWEGIGSGQPGQSKIQREYQLVLNEKYIQVQNKSTYDPQPKNPKGEVHQLMDA